MHISYWFWFPFTVKEIEGGKYVCRVEPTSLDLSAEVELVVTREFTFYLQGGCPL